ncbi:hypothetical protein PBY51_015801 [Eleginops maclovinus]|uniref:Uncharacterized protein n=1 Tax=Eleginops maclovinus TaxID=56733 RepID=A0AAN8ALN6_ELEMC|nr:hypothetical protein PBY51_015801 [Eleginops maclovinus]
MQECMYKPRIMLGCSKVEAQYPISSLVDTEKRIHHSLPVGCLVDSNKRSSRFTGAHWRTRSSEHSAQSQDLQSPQPIRGYTGGLSCWWVGQSTAMKHGQLPVLLQMDDETGNYGVQVETRSCVLDDR